MPRTHVLNGSGLDAAVRAVERQVVFWYPSVGARDADLRAPWDGLTTLYPTGSGLVLESWYAGAWRRLSAPGSAGGGAGIDQATADLRYVNVTGDAITGQLLAQPPLASFAWQATGDVIRAQYDTGTDGLTVQHTADATAMLALDGVQRRALVYGSPVVTEATRRPRLLLATKGTWAGASFGAALARTRVWTVNPTVAVGHLYRVAWGWRAVSCMTVNTNIRQQLVTGGPTTDLAYDGYLTLPANAGWAGGDFTTLFTASGAGVLAIGLDIIPNTASTVGYNDNNYTTVEDLGVWP